MTTDRARAAAVQTLVQHAQTAGYGLPDDVIRAYRVWEQLKATVIPPPGMLHIEDAAASVVAALADGNGQVPDLAALGAQFDRVQADRRAYDHANELLSLAIEQAGNAAVQIATDAADLIIAEHLQPAHAEVLGLVRDVAELLRPHTDGALAVDTHSVITANAKVRNAYLQLPGLVEQFRLILDARSRVNLIGLRTVEHDHDGLFSVFANPTALFAGWIVGQPVPPIPYPTDPTARLLWIASEDVAPAKPWLPTTTEQDAAYWALFGDLILRSRQDHHNVRAMAEMAAGLESRDGTATPIPRPAREDNREAISQRLFGTQVNGGPVEKE